MGKPSKREIIYEKKQKKTENHLTGCTDCQTDRMSTQLNEEYAKSRGNDLNALVFILYLPTTLR